MRILSLDPATKTGFALWDNGNIISGTWDCSIQKDESKDFRLIRLRSKLEEIFNSGKIDYVFYEISKDARYAHAIHVAGQIEGVILVWCHDKNIQFYSFKPTEIKKHATGIGNSGKKFVQVAAIKKFGKQGIDDNEADALWILDLGLARYSGALK